MLDGRRVPAALVAFDSASGQLRARRATGPGVAPPDTHQLEEQVPLAEVHRWGSPAPARRRPRVLIRGGGRLVAAPTWTLDGSILLIGDRLTVRQTMLDDAVVPRSSVRGVDFALARDPDRHEAIAREAAGYDGAADRVWLTSGDAFAGQVDAIASGRLSMRVGPRGERSPVELSLDRVAALRLADRPSVRGLNPPRLAIGLADGGLLVAESASLTAGGKLRVGLAGGVVLRGGRTGAVTLVQPLSGGCVYASSLDPIDYLHTPYLGGPVGLAPQRYAQDANLLGGPLTAGGVGWLRGVAMPADSRLVYRVPTGAAMLVGRLALDDSSVGGDVGGSVLFRVLVARGGSFAEAFRSGVVRTGEDPIDLSAPVAGAKAVALLVERAGRGATRDHAAWLGLRFVTGKGRE